MFRKSTFIGTYSAYYRFTASLVAPLGLVALGLLIGCSASDDTKGKSGGSQGDTGFRPKKDGFGFANYGNSDIPNLQNLTVAEVRRMFGDVACASLSNGECTLTPTMQKAMEAANKAMDGGHCEGMAVLSSLIHAKKVAISDFGTAATPADLAIKGNERLQREIAYWWATQTLPPVTKAREEASLAPSVIVERLTKALGERSDETYSIAFFKRDMTGGHAVTPYAVVPGDNGTMRVMVYDNNFPGEERFFVVDPKAETWSYAGTTRPDLPSDNYDGDASSKSFSIVPSSVRMGQHECPFCKDVSASGPAVSSRNIQAIGSARILIANEQGKKLGYEGTSFVDEMSGGQAIPILSGKYQLPSYQIDEDTELTITLDGSTLAQTETTDLSIAGAGVTFGVEGISLDPSQKDTIVLAKDNSEITYITSGHETPTVLVGFQSSGPDYLIAIRAGGDPNGQQIDLKLDFESGKARIRVAGGGSTSYAVEIHKIDAANGDAVFTHSANNIGDQDTVYLDFGSWQGDDSPLTMEVDQGSDGSIDSSADLSDEN